MIFEQIYLRVELVVMEMKSRVYIHKCARIGASPPHAI